MEYDGRKSFDRFFREAVEAIFDSPDLGYQELAVYTAYWKHLNPSRSRKRAKEEGRVRIDSAHPSVPRIALLVKMSRSTVSKIVLKAIATGDFVIIRTNKRGQRHFAFRHFRDYFWPEFIVPPDMEQEAMDQWYSRRENSLLEGIAVRHANLSSICIPVSENIIPKNKTKENFSSPRELH